MTAPRGHLVAAKNKGRSRTTNGGQLINGVDGRSTQARRWRDLVCIFAAEYEIRTDGDLSLVETAATLKCALEKQNAQMCLGERVDMQELGRLSCELRDTLETLKRNAQTRGPVEDSTDADYGAEEDQQDD
jgi:hypothetical protein